MVQPRKATDGNDWREGGRVPDTKTGRRQYLTTSQERERVGLIGPKNWAEDWKDSEPVQS